MNFGILFAHFKLKNFFMKHLFLLITMVFMAIMGLKAETLEWVDDFQMISVFGKLQVRLIKSDSSAIEIKEAFEISHEVKNGILYIKRTNNLTQPIETTINVYYKDINRIKAAGGAKIFNRGIIEVHTLNILTKTGTEIDLVVKCDSVNLSAKRNAMVFLSGSSPLLNARLCFGSHLQTNKLVNQNSNVLLRGGSAEMSATGKITAKVSLGGILRYNKSVTQTEIKESMGGNAEVLQE